MMMCPAATPFSVKFSENLAACSGTPSADNQSAPAGCAPGEWMDGEVCKGCSKGFYCPEGAKEEMMCPAETPFSDKNSTNAGACNGGNWALNENIMNDCKARYVSYMWSICKFTDQCLEFSIYKS